MRGWMLLWVVIGVWVIGAGGVSSVAAQAITPPTIVSFTGRVAAQTAPDIAVSQVAINEAEAGGLSLTLSWRVLDASAARHRLILETYRIAQWNVITPEDDPERAWGFAGQRTLDLQHPLNFGEPTYRLRIVDTDEVTIDERVVVIPFDASLGGNLPNITTFDVIPDGVEGAALLQNTARVEVVWSVSNRLPGSHIVFEQVLDDGSAVDVELPRDNLWVSSFGQGVVAPMLPPLNRQAIQLRLRVININTGEVYAEDITPLPIIGGEEIPPTGGVSGGSGGSNAGGGGSNAGGGGSNASPQPERLVPLPNITQSNGGGGDDDSTSSDSSDDAGSSDPSSSDESDAEASESPQVDQTAADNCTLSPLEVPRLGTPDDNCGIYVDPETGEAVEISAFTVDARSMAPGGTVVLTWEMAGAGQAIIEVYSIREINNGAGNPAIVRELITGLPLMGRVNVDIPLDFLDGAKIILWAANVEASAGGAAISMTERLAYKVIEVPTPDIGGDDSGDSNTTDDDSSDAEGDGESTTDGSTGDVELGTSTLQAAYQPFETGFMVWKESDNVIWVFINSGELQIFPPGEYTGFPDNPVTDEPPASRVKPISGFGRVWGNIDYIRESLGWGLERESPYDLTLETRNGENGLEYEFVLPNGQRVIAQQNGRWRYG